jgi:hypothetical protein
MSRDNGYLQQCPGGDATRRLFQSDPCIAGHPSYYSDTRSTQVCWRWQGSSEQHCLSSHERNSFCSWLVWQLLSMGVWLRERYTRLSPSQGSCFQVETADCLKVSFLLYDLNLWMDLWMKPCTSSKLQCTRCFGFRCPLFVCWKRDFGKCFFRIVQFLVFRGKRDVLIFPIANRAIGNRAYYCV